MTTMTTDTAERRATLRDAFDAVNSEPEVVYEDGCPCGFDDCEGHYDVPRPPRSYPKSDLPF